MGYFWLFDNERDIGKINMGILQEIIKQACLPPDTRLLLGDSKWNIFQSSCSTVGDHKKMKKKKKRSWMCDQSKSVWGHGNKVTTAPNPRGEGWGQQKNCWDFAFASSLECRPFDFESLQQCKVKYQRFYQLFTQKRSAGRKVKSRCYSAWVRPTRFSENIEIVLTYTHNTLFRFFH